MENLKEKIALLENYIMKKCLWQFNSRAWDRKDQNDNIFKKTEQMLCEERVELETAADKCYWVDAVCMVKDFKRLYPWINTLNKEELKELIHGLKERIDFLTITGSLNKELTDVNY
jgi:Fe-only nitrogenase delta subunit